MNNKEILVKSLTKIISGEVNIAEAETILSRDVICHLDNYTFYGIDAWKAWVTFIRSRKKVSDLQLICDRIISSSYNTTTLYGHWKGVNNNNKLITSEKITVIYCFNKYKIIEIWTLRTNYLFIFGKIIQSKIGLLFLFLVMFKWLGLDFKKAYYFLFSRI